MPQVNNNEVPMYGSADAETSDTRYCECEKQEVKPHQEFVEIDGIRLHVPDSGVFPAICNNCNLEIKKGDLK